MAPRASAARAARWACCTTTPFMAAARRGGRAPRAAARAQSLRLLAPAAHQRGQRRPQPQLPRLRAAAGAQCRLCRGARVDRAGEWPPDGGERTPAARLRRRARRAGAAGGRQRRPMRVSRRPLLRRRASRVEQSRAARRAAGAGCALRHARLDRLPHGPRSARPRREDLRRAAAPRISTRAKAVVGRRRHVVPRRFVDVGAADRRQLQRGLRRMPAGGVRGHRARVRHAAVRGRAAGAAGRPVARQSRRRGRGAAGGDQGPRPRGVLPGCPRLEAAGLRPGARRHPGRAGCAGPTRGTAPR